MFAKTVLALGVIAACCGAPAGAAGSCMQKATTQMAMDACASAEAATADAHLAAAYKTLLARASGQMQAVANIHTAQRAWVAYRDAFLAAAFPAADKQAAYGSIYPMEAAELRARLTEQQIVAVKALADRYAPQ